MPKTLVVAMLAVAFAAAAFAYQDGNTGFVLTEKQVKTVTAAAGKAVTINLTGAQIEHLRTYYPNAKVTKMTLTSANVAKSGWVSYVPPDDKATVLKARGGGE